jgi:hypothetical protein
VLHGREKAPKKARVHEEARARAVIRATDILLTHDVYRIGPGWACRARPKWGAASEMSPNLAPLLPSLRAVAPPDALRVVWRIVLRLVVPKVRKTEAVAVLRFHEGEGGAGL